MAQLSILSQLTIQFQISHRAMHTGVSFIGGVANICAKYRTSHLKDSALTSNVPQDTCGTCSATFVPEGGLEPTHLSILHFECNASTNSAIRAGHLVYFTRVFRIAKRYCVLW